MKIINDKGNLSLKVDPVTKKIKLVIGKKEEFIEDNTEIIVKIKEICFWKRVWEKIKSWF